MASGMEVQEEKLAFEARFDLVFDLVRADDHTTIIACSAAAFAAPHTSGRGTA
jgi:hypothetical protein